MASLRIPRRSFLTGLAGASVALPFLEAMLPRKAWAAGTAPCRFVSMFGGVEQLHSIPSSTGPGYTMPDGLASLESVRDHVSVVTGLSIGTGDPVPAGGKTNPHHGNIMMPLLTGFRSTNDNHGVPNAATADQIAADVYGGDTHFRSLEFRAQPVGYRGGSSGTKAQMSYREGGGANVPQASPQLAYESVFTGFTPPDASPADLEAQAKLLARRLSVLDLVKARGDDLVGKVSRADQIRLERHFDEIRDLETRLAEIPTTSDSAACMALGDPGADPTQANFPNTVHGGSAGYSDEAARASLFVDLIAMALVCDLTRVASLMITMEQSMMSLAPLWGVDFEMHDLTHHDDIPNRNQIWNDVSSWHVSFFGDLVARLAAEPEPTGGYLLDNTVLVMSQSGGPTGHGTTNMSMQIAGRPSVLRAGVHVVAGAHPSNVYQTALHAIGIDVAFGEVPDIVDGLLV